MKRDDGAQVGTGRGEQNRRRAPEAIADCRQPARVALAAVVSGGREAALARFCHSGTFSMSCLICAPASSGPFATFPPPNMSQAKAT